MVEGEVAQHSVGGNVTVRFPHGVESVDMLICSNVSCSSLEYKCLVLSTQKVGWVFCIGLVHIPEEGPSSVCSGPFHQPLVLGFGAKDASTGL